ncbi:MAG: hypothetical protein LKM39_04035 [Chiayiivirga sp.]|jgi:cytochrome c biogenesis protein CcmG/thiol:disulfide interchange protein DsbE|nr:hypothetical protein [Chiayiivirga sp.]
MFKRLLPLLVFVALGVLLYAGIELAKTRDPNAIPSPLIGKPAPEFALPLLHEPGKTLTRADLLGQPYVLNVWGSWVPELPAGTSFCRSSAKSGKIRVIGFNYKDEREDCAALARTIRQIRTSSAWWIGTAGRRSTSASAPRPRPS